MHRLPLLWLDWSGARVGSVDALRVGDFDEPRRRVRLRASISKTRKALWVDLPDEYADALEASLVPREDRDPAARLFAESGGGCALHRNREIVQGLGQTAASRIVMPRCTSHLSDRPRRLQA